MSPVILRVASSHNPPTILVEYHEDASLKTRHRRIHIKEMKPNANVDRLADRLFAKHGRLLSRETLLRLLLQLKAKIELQISTSEEDLSPPVVVRSRLPTKKTLPNRNLLASLESSDESPVAAVDVRSTSTTSQLRSYTMAEISSHRSKDDCWVLIDGMVYDVSSWMDQHPGGEAILLQHAGTDSTQPFSRMHSTHAIEMLSRFRIGTLNLTSSRRMAPLDSPPESSASSPSSSSAGPQELSSAKAALMSSTSSSSSSTTTTESTPSFASSSLSSLGGLPPVSARKSELSDLPPLGFGKPRLPFKAVENSNVPRTTPSTVTASSSPPPTSPLVSPIAPVSNAGETNDNTVDPALKDAADTLLSMITAKWKAMGRSGPVAFIWDAKETEKLLSLIRTLCTGLSELLETQSYPFLQLHSPLVVLGDLHGNFDDLNFLIEALRLDEAVSTNPLAVPIKELQTLEHALVLESPDVVCPIPLTELVGARTPGSMPWPPVKIAQTSSTLDPSKDPRQVPKSVVFMGDYVDRGNASIEVVACVLALKVRHPTAVHVLRGNHETLEVNEAYGFRSECLTTFGNVTGEKVFKMFNDVFAFLPLAASIDNTVFCAHGGVPRCDVDGKDDRMAILRETNWTSWRDRQGPNPQIEATGDNLFERQTRLFYDLMWADPAQNENRLDPFGFGPSIRGVGCVYGQRAINAFLRSTKFQMIIRAHEPKSIGFQIQKEGKVITVFSSGEYNQPDDVCGALFFLNGTVQAITRARPRAAPRFNLN